MYNSNQTGLRIAEEATPKVLGGSPVWEPVEPNSYGDFGGEFQSTARAPIVSDRQRRQGSITDLDAMAGYQVDLTTKSLRSTIQGFMFASWRKKTELNPSAVSGTLYTVASGGAGFLVNSLAFGEGFAVAGNNGLHLVSASAGTTVTAAGLAIEASPPAGASIVRVGHQGASGDLTLTVSGTQATLGSTALNLTTLGLMAGEWVWLGGDSAGLRFATAANAGFYRILSIAATAIIFDRIPDSAATDAGAGKTIQIFFGQVLKNESDPTLQVKRTYQAERIYDTASTKIEYILGLVGNTLKATTKTADKLTVELDFVGLDSDATQVTPKSGDRPAVAPQTAFSSSSDFQRLRLLNNTDSSQLSVYLTDFELSIDNGVTADKAIGYLGGVDHSLGDFMVSGSVEAYFSSMAAVAAVKANDQASLDFGLVANVYTPGVGNQAAGWLFDVPAISLGDARLKVEKDKKIKLPLNIEATAHSTLNHTLLLVNYQYLPQLAL